VEPEPVTGELVGKRAAVTGAARGIGRACAVRLAELGADVAVIDIDLRSGRHYEGEPAGTTQDQIEQFGRRAAGIQADLSVERDARSAIAAAVEAWDGLDILVNVAGGAVTPYERSRATHAPVEDIRRLIDINLMSTIYCCQAAAPALRASGSGAIVNVASTAAFTVFPDGSNAAYAMTKAAVLHWSRHLAAELGPDGVRVNLFAPGITLTGRVVAESAVTGYASRAQEVPLGRLGTPEDCADVMEFLVTDRSRFVTGRCIPVDGGWVFNAC
jgi:NAD(P)-dependent dehydrogenase (short-subunit alcohol dehydrogenase family)